MIYFGIQLYETFMTHKIFVFEIFVIYVWSIWMIKLISSRRYTKHVGCVKDKFKTTVLMAVLNEKKTFLLSH